MTSSSRLTIFSASSSSTRKPSIARSRSSSPTEPQSPTSTATSASQTSHQWQDGYDAQVAARRRQIDSMMAFAEGATCRMTALVDHFGDRSDPLRSCGLCDICQPSSATGSAMRQPDGSEREDLRSILTAVASRSTSTGKLFTDLALTKDRKHFDALLDGLARAGLLTLTNDTFRTPEGRDVTYRKACITHEGRTPNDETLSTVWLRDTATTSSKRTSKRTNKREPKRRATSTPEPTRRTREPQSQLPIARREATRAPQTDTTETRRRSGRAQPRTIGTRRPPARVAQGAGPRRWSSLVLHLQRLRPPRHRPRNTLITFRPPLHPRPRPRQARPLRPRSP